MPQGMDLLYMSTVCHVDYNSICVYGSILLAFAQFCAHVDYC